MEEKKSGFSLVGILLIILLVTIIGSAIFLVITITRTIDSALSPVQSVNKMLSTQVSQLLNPTPTVIPDPITIIREVQSLARLETIQYSVEKIITAEVNQGVLGPLFGDRLLLVAHGFVIAGVDLADISPEDLRLEDGILFVTLPEAEVFVATLNNERSYVYDRTTGVLAKK
jgi:predicted PurR-regulated permease PerM